MDYCLILLLQFDSLPELQELADFPFTWARSLTSANICKLLEAKGCHRKGIWTRECACSSTCSWGSLGPELPQSLEHWPSDMALSECLRLSKAHLNCLSAAVRLLHQAAVLLWDTQLSDIPGNCGRWLHPLLVWCWC